MLVTREPRRYVSKQWMLYGYGRIRDSSPTRTQSEYRPMEGTNSESPFIRNLSLFETSPDQASHMRTVAGIYVS